MINVLKVLFLLYPSVKFCVDGALDTKIGVIPCGENLHFNPVLGVCDEPENLDEPCVDAKMLRKSRFGRILT